MVNPARYHVRPRRQAGSNFLVYLLQQIRKIRYSLSLLRSVVRYQPPLVLVLELAIIVFLYSYARRNRSGHGDSASATLRLGLMEADITPTETVFLSGFSSRHEPPRSTVLLTSLSPLRVKVLALELPEQELEGEGSASKLVIITFDLVGMDRHLSDAIFESLLDRYGLQRDQVRLVFSHTHSGPAVGGNLYSLVPDSDVERAKISRYADFLWRTVLDTVGTALTSENTQLVRVFFGTGSCSIAVNRRQVSEHLFEDSENHGDVDSDLPVIWFRKMDKSNKIVAGIFGFSAHATVLTSTNQYSGDYPAAVTAALADAYPGSTWFFLPGCGGDLNIYPRGNMTMLLKHRDAIVKEVTQVVAKEKSFKPVFTEAEKSAKLFSHHSFVPLRFRQTYSRGDLRRMSRSVELITSRTAKALMSTLTIEHRTKATYPFPMSIIRIGSVRLLFLGGEPTVDYASRLRIEAGVSWVVGYTDDVMGYVGSARVLREGHREGSDRAALYYGLPCTWDASVEETIVNQALVLRSVEELK